MNPKRKGKAMWTPEKIKELRKKYGETQEDFCVRLGISLDGLRYWEQGKGFPGGSATILLGRLEEDYLEGKIRDLNSLGQIGHDSKEKQPA